MGGSQVWTHVTTVYEMCELQVHINGGGRMRLYPAQDQTHMEWFTGAEWRLQNLSYFVILPFRRASAYFMNYCEGFSDLEQE